ncbi:MAG: hypothetical protein RLZZ540_2723 [Bacteroidota bacterium]|jgi:hypothetical protein
MKKAFLFSLFLLFSLATTAQTYIKANALTALVVVPNIGIETSINKKTTFQTDMLASFWKSINGLPFKFVTVTTEFRHHFYGKYNGPFVGLNIGGSSYDVSKGSHAKLNEHEIGFGYMIGTSVGYEKKINDKLLLDFFVGGGWHQGYYRGYNILTGERYESVKNYNKSGEWLTYRGGIMISYKLN